MRKLLVFEPPNPNERPDLGEILQKGKLVKHFWGETIQSPINELVALDVMDDSLSQCKFSESDIDCLNGHLLLLYFPEEEENKSYPDVSVVEMRRTKSEVNKALSDKIHT
ncbi:MAG: hypothetical protein WD425_21925 [Nitrospirales bacterium]